MKKTILWPAFLLLFAGLFTFQACDGLLDGEEDLNDVQAPEMLSETMMSPDYSGMENGQIDGSLSTGTEGMDLQSIDAGPYDYHLSSIQEDPRYFALQMVTFGHRLMIESLRELVMDTLLAEARDLEPEFDGDEFIWSYTVNETLDGEQIEGEVTLTARFVNDETVEWEMEVDAPDIQGTLFTATTTGGGEEGKFTFFNLEEEENGVEALNLEWELADNELVWLEMTIEGQPEEDDAELDVISSTYERDGDIITLDFTTNGDQPVSEVRWDRVIGAGAITVVMEGDTVQYCWDNEHVPSEECAV